MLALRYTWPSVDEVAKSPGQVYPPGAAAAAHGSTLREPAAARPAAKATAGFDLPPLLLLDLDYATHDSSDRPAATALPAQRRRHTRVLPLSDYIL